MPTDVAELLPRFAEALDWEAPAISVDEIRRRGTVAFEIDRLEWPVNDPVTRVTAVSFDDAVLGHGENGERDALIEFTSTVGARTPSRHRVVLRVALGVAAAAVLVVALAAIVPIVDDTGPDDGPSLTVPTPPAIVPGDSFVGVWLSIDTDGSSQTMEVARSGTDGYDVVIRDEAATAACEGGASTLTGAGRLTTGTSLVIAHPELTCDDGTTPANGPPPQAELVNYALDLDTATGGLVDRFGVVWQRKGSEVDELEPPVTVPASASETSGRMWPQSTLDEVHAAQELADAGNPDYSWQIDARLVDDYWSYLVDGAQVELVDRFLREVLGWEAYVFNTSYEGDRNAAGAIDGAADGMLTDQRFLRCAPGRTNPLYPPQPDLDHGGESCAPTLDDLSYESVSVDLSQLDRTDSGGIWVVDGWRLTAPFVQADPVVAEAQTMERLEEFLAARIAGEGAEGHVQVDQGVVDIPLLYATASGTAYERYDIDRVDGPHWPDSWATFRVRLFTDGDATVVEQEITSLHGGRLSLDGNSTTQNGQPVVLTHTSSDGEVSVSAPSTWEAWLPGKDAEEEGSDVWFGGLWRPEATFGSGERIEFTDPVAYDEWCATNGGSPLLTGPADAAAIALQLAADPNFETTAPVAARIGGLEALSIDVALAPGGQACGVGMIDISRWIHTIGWDPGERLRLYLVDLPEGMPAPTLAITVVAPKERFEAFLAETAPIIDSIEFHPR